MFNYMAMAGWKVDDMLNGIEGIMNLAAASGADLATTSDIVTDALTAMGYSAGDAGRLADVMAAASSNANTNVEMMGGTFKYVAPLIGAMGYNMEDAAVQIGLMANSGIKAEKAGTALRSILSRLAAPPKECATAMEALGLSITDTDGTMKSLDAVMGEMREAFADLSETEQTQIAKQIAGQEAMSGLLAIVNAAPADYKKLRDAVDKSSGSAQHMADTMNDNVGGAMTLLKSQIEGIQIDLYNKLAPAFRTIIDKISKKLASVDWGKFGDKLAKGFDVAIDILEGLFKAVGKVFGFIKDNWKGIVTALSAIAGGFVAFKVASLIMSVVTAIKGFVTAMKTAETVTAAMNATLGASPWMLLAAGIGAAVGGLIALVGTSDDAKDSMQEAEEETESLADKFNEAAAAARENEEALAKTAAANISQVDYAERRLIPMLQDLVDENGKVKKGEEERAQYILGELNEALGTEYDSINDIFDANGKLKESIYDVINARKAQIYLDTYEEDYKNAIMQQADAYGALAEKAVSLSDIEQEITRREGEVYRQRGLQFNSMDAERQREIENERKLALSRDEKYQNLLAQLEATQAEYTETARNVAANEEKIQRYNDATTAVIEGNTEKAIAIMQDYNHQVVKVEDIAEKSAREQEQILADQVIATETSYRLMVENHKASWGKMSETARKEAKAQEDAAKKLAEEAKSEFKKVGGNITLSISDGAKSQSWVLSDSMERTIQNAVNAAKTAAGGAYGIGANFAYGLNDGYTTAIESFYHTIETSSNYAKYKIEQIWGVSSPSKVMKRIGQYIVQGEVLGIESEQKHLNDALKGLGHDSQASLVSGMTSRTAMRTSAKQNEVGMVDQFKQALAEMKIELDDRVAGKFVERTVARAIY